MTTAVLQHLISALTTIAVQRLRVLLTTTIFDKMPYPESQRHHPSLTEEEFASAGERALSCEALRDLPHFAPRPTTAPGRVRLASG